MKCRYLIGTLKIMKSLFLANLNTFLPPMQFITLVMFVCISPYYNSTYCDSVFNSKIFKIQL